MKGDALCVSHSTFLFPVHSLGGLAFNSPPFPFLEMKIRMSSGNPIQPLTASALHNELVGNDAQKAQTDQNCLDALLF